MKINEISVYQVDLPLPGGGIDVSGGTTPEMATSTIVAVETSTGLVGWGESCPIGVANSPSCGTIFYPGKKRKSSHAPNARYVPTFATGIRAGIEELAPHLIGEDPRCLNRINYIMDGVLLNHNYVKTAVDLACWDILGKLSSLPVCDLMGGRMCEDVELVRAIFADTPEKTKAQIDGYRAEGFKVFQVKVGGSPEDDIERLRFAAANALPGDILMADANRGWRVHEAIRVARATKDLDIYFEQPCSSYEDCLIVRHQIDNPFVLDESMNSVDTLLRAHSDGAMDVVVLKLSNVGGLSKMRQMKDLCVALGIPMRIEDAWGSDIVAAASAHISHTVPQDLMMSCYDKYTTIQVADGGPERTGAHFRASTAPGLGVTPRSDVLGDPVAVYH
jgi:L-alanine-DL-glutamate epimerase-like enolase superfamily enzyme